MTPLKELKDQLSQEGISFQEMGKRPPKIRIHSHIVMQSGNWKSDAEWSEKVGKLARNENCRVEGEGDHLDIYDR
jgi:hypothetical protein